MLILPALFSLLTFLYWRPHQFFPQLRPISLNLLLGFAIFSLLLDLRAGWSRLRASPLLVFVGAFTIWSFVTVVAKAPDQLGAQFAKLNIPFLLVVFISWGLQSLRALKVTANVLMVFSLALATLGVVQGMSPKLCYLDEGSELLEESPLGFDGRPCDDRKQCREGGLPGGEYQCAHPGWLGTSSLGERVRYTGMLEDPNELAWVLSMAVPFLFLFYETTRERWRLVLLIAGIAVTATCVIMTKSRSGQLSLLATLGFYFVRRYRVRGLVAAVLASLPVLILGGRSGAEADSSTEERLVCWSEGLSMWRENPLLGVGSGQFTEHHIQTAHDAFLLVAAETGPLGLLLWTAALYFAFKVLFRIQSELRTMPEAAAARSFAVALLASFAALLVSCLFLSLSLHPVLWIHLALSGALYSIVQRHDPNFRVGFTKRDLMFVAAFDVVFIGWMNVYLRIKGT